MNTNKTKSFSSVKTKKKRTKSEKVTRESNIAKVVLEHPEVTDVLMSFGLHCVGCFASAFDTIGEGSSLHGMSDDEIDEMLVEVNKVVRNPNILHD